MLCQEKKMKKMYPVQPILVGLARHMEKSWKLRMLGETFDSLAMMVHGHDGHEKILSRYCHDLGKHSHASCQTYNDQLHFRCNHF